MDRETGPLRLPISSLISTRIFVNCEGAARSSVSFGTDTSTMTPNLAGVDAASSAPCTSAMTMCSVRV